MLNELLSAILQILVFTSIPFLTYLIKNKTTKGFFNYIGLKASTSRANFLAILAFIFFAGPLLLLTFTNEEFKAIMLDPNSITGKFREMGLSVESIGILLIIAILKTSLAEEILFRGFIAKRLISVMGYQKGNITQSLIFGILHAILFSLITMNIFFLTIIFVVPTIGAYVSTYLNEKAAKGSIIPGWISHALANMVSYVVIGFLI